MSYQVLARKWRPQRFNQLVGQDHVVKALTNALDQDRLHHAYLFTGTRGVGKTTLARILAKSLNCETGVTSTPCCQCDSCMEIEQGRFVDLIEVDAASRTKVEQTRELLENVPYAPVRGRYKVYLIDEVHMFSESSFNALLKTLEEPPPHVKFVLATTDPQKVPVTVLSRCLQFNLKRLDREQISAQLEHILQQESMTFESAALTLIARAADSSMRDALSLLDQAIGYGAGQIKTDEVSLMLGLVGADPVLGLLEALADTDGQTLLERIAEMAQASLDFAQALKDLLLALHQLTLLQTIKGFMPEDQYDSDRIQELSNRISPEDVQLYYQIALMGQKELYLAPDPRSGFEMILLRMLAFRPAGQSDAPAAPPLKTQKKTQPETRTGQSSPKMADVPVSAHAADQLKSDPSDWLSFVGTLKLGGIASQLAHHCVFNSWDGKVLKLTLDEERHQLLVGQAHKRFQDGIRKKLGPDAQLSIKAGRVEEHTPADLQAQAMQEQQQRAETGFNDDPLVREMNERFGAMTIPGSVKPVKH